MNDNVIFVDFKNQRRTNHDERAASMARHPSNFKRNKDNCDCGEPDVYDGYADCVEHPRFE